MILSNELYTKQVEYINIFAQAEINEQIYIEPPCGFGWVDKIPKASNLLKSIYGLKQAPNTFFDKLKAGLIIQSEIDK